MVPDDLALGQSEEVFPEQDVNVFRGAVRQRIVRPGSFAREKREYTPCSYTHPSDVRVTFVVLLARVTSRARPHPHNFFRYIFRESHKKPEFKFVF